MRSVESEAEGSDLIFREANRIPELHSTFAGGLFLALADGDGRMYGGETLLSNEASGPSRTQRVE